MGVAEKIIEGA